MEGKRIICTGEEWNIWAKEEKANRKVVAKLSREKRKNCEEKGILEYVFKKQ